MYPATFAKSDPDRPAVILAPTGEVVTYRQLDERSNQFAHYLRGIGLRPGAVVAVLMAGYSRFHEVAWAARRSGLIATTVNRHLSLDDLTHVINDSGATVLVVDAELADVAAELTAAAIPAVTHRLMVGGATAGFASYTDAVAAMPTTPLPDEMEGDLLTYSSGTTGRPKGVYERVGGGPISADTDPYLPRGPLGDLGAGSVLLAPGLHHGGPCYLSMAAQRLGGTVVVLPEFDAATALEVIDRYGVTHATMAPYMFVRMLKLPERQRASYRVDTLRMVLVSFAPTPVPVWRAMVEWWGPVLFQLWGSSEKAGGAFITCAEWEDHPGSVGRPIGATVHILDDDGVELPPRAIGTMWFADSFMQPEFHNAAAAVVHRNDQGWVEVGDVGFVDEDGYLYQVDRKSSEIRVSGTVVWPQQVEDVLISHPDVLDAAVFGLPDAQTGEQVRAVVQLVNPDARTVSAGELAEFCAARLTPAQCPVAFDVADRLPRSDTGKLYRRQLRAEYLSQSLVAHA